MSEPRSPHHPPQEQDRQPGLRSEMTPRPRAEMRDYRGTGKLAGKVALVTGGDSGIGRAVAIGLAKEGADVAILYLDEHGDARSTQGLIEEQGRRCLAIADGFYEFTAPDDPKAKRKNKWLFSPVEGEFIGIAAVTQTHPEVGEAFSLLTAEPSPEVAVIHNRQIILPKPGHWLEWLDSSTSLPPSSNWSTVSANRITEMGLET